ncbi:E1-E2 ATPase family protein (macronuclear) [Tetrahymena thermophila SB210]|uniref:Cation-transporting ATPase n=1 Tax=Tetrahymena thermophila (strain SB210) TaxID=312017 RepID=Q23TT6_TETTS|nr:E1-E2 ATPase family protein [Tetrahymena thermophila SB210]EAR99959.2 E1-E2 ATPase family protein [Tetrahymena thermophila SB210]|eukprot:XP_001020204.2 E1-E2 ATPase family protein [Tetrahymena thermophila SB210]
MISSQNPLKEKLIPFDQEESAKNIEKKENSCDFVLPDDVQEEGIIKSIEAYEISNIKLIFSYFLFVFSGGILYLFSRWQINFKIMIQMKSCDQSKARFLKITSGDDVETLETVVIKEMNIDNKLKEYLTFTFRLYSYYYDDLQNSFHPIQFALNRKTNNEIHTQYGRGIKDQESLDQLKSIYGLNNTEIPDKTTVKILFDEVLSPFYLFQLFSFVLWFILPYYYYATIILVTSVFSAVINLLEAKNNYSKLKKMSYFETPVYVYRCIQDYIIQGQGMLNIALEIIKKRQEISSIHLVPGDIIEITDGQIMPCDVILLNGSCIMNESMLTGESIPIMKSSLPYNNNYYSSQEEGKQSTLFAGTKCIETRYYMKGKIPVLGLVSQTSFNTMKGQLVRSILYPKSNSFSFYVDSLKFIACMAVMSVLGFIYSLPDQIQGLREGFVDPRDMFLHSLDLVTITVPPALPTCLSVGISFAINRLKNHKIFCISPPKVNISGKVTIMCFDKTGTLTEEGLDMYGVRPICYNSPNNVKFLKLVEDTKDLGKNKKVKLSTIAEDESIYGEQNPFSFVGDPEIVLKECMASCHGITRVKGELIGDPLEVKMFEATQWELIENDMGKYDELVLAIVQPTQKEELFNNDVNTIEKSIIKKTLPTSIGIIKRFEFSSKLQRMSTIVRNLSNDTDFFRLHVKGSPEKIFELSRPSSIPHNFHKVLDFYARKGFRVLAFGIRMLKMTYRKLQKMDREDLEKDLIFTGLLIMENKLKPITTEIIDKLSHANIRTIMVTGDNALTAISVGRQCNIVRQDMRVYFGDLQDDPDNPDEQYIEWKDFEMGDKVLDEDNLQPVGGVAQYQEEGVPEIKEEKELFEELEIIEHNEKIISSSRNSIKSPFSALTGNNRRSLFNQLQKLRKSGGVPSTLDLPDILNHDDNNEDKEEQGNEEVPEKEEMQALVYTDINMLAKYKEQQVPWVNQEAFALAITGRAFSKIISEADQSEAKTQLAETMLQRTQIFARMKPDEKAQLLQSLQKLPWKPTCGMCGDGANDCGALKTADIGISLSEAEASIAAPFTSKVQDISCVISLLKEGRAALVTSFSCFKFMALYSMIQFFTTTLLYTVQSLPGDFQFLYWDVVIILPLAFFMGLTDSYDKLSKQVPGSSLVSFPVLCSVIGQVAINGLFQIYLFFTLKSQSWYLSVKQAHSYIGDLDELDGRKSCYESTTLFFFTNFQYVATCLSFSIGKPFKKPFYTNKYFTGSVIGILLIGIYVQLFYDPFTKYMLDIFDKVQRDDEEPISVMPKSWNYYCLYLSGINFVVCIFFERFVLRFLTFLYLKVKGQNIKQITTLQPQKKH